MLSRLAPSVRLEMHVPLVFAHLPKDGRLSCCQFLVLSRVTYGRNIVGPWRAFHTDARLEPSSPVVRTDVADHRGSVSRPSPIPWTTARVNPS